MPRRGGQDAFRGGAAQRRQLPGEEAVRAGGALGFCLRDGVAQGGEEGAGGGGEAGEV